LRKAVNTNLRRLDQVSREDREACDGPSSASRRATREVDFAGRDRGEPAARSRQSRANSPALSRFGLSKAFSLCLIAAKPIAA
jgi:hypothetical protein